MEIYLLRNQIIKVTDAVDDGPYYQGAWHYRDNADKQQERFYDGNGNLTKDLDAKISDIQYNSLNLSLMNVGCGSEKPKQVWFFAHLSLHLPMMITFTDGSTTRYTYDATGRKLRTEHRVMTTGVFNPGQELLDDAGVLDEPGVEMPAPDFPGLNGPAAVMMPQEMEQAAPPAISDAEEASGSPKRPRSTGDAPAEYLPYELTVTDYCGNYVYENGKLSRILFDGGYITFPDTTVNEVTIANINKPQYHFYFTDHLGNVRVVTDANGNVEQVNNYYPYGGLMASSSIANPVSQTNVAANQPNRYNGKELDRKNGLDWMDYGARHFAGHGQWTSPDPLAEKYYDSTPFGYCRNNPINKIDPDGRDEWEINKKGYIVNHIKTNEHDAFFVVNRKGKRIQDKSITFRFGTIEKATGHKDAKGYSYDLYQVRRDSNGTSLFEFVAKNTDVEWSQIKTGIKGNKGLNFLTTSHEHASERGSTDLYDKQLRHGYTIREDIHSHPENTPYPSGLEKKKGDISNAAYVVQRTGQQPQFKIYIPGENRYIQYNQDSLEKDFVLEFRYSIDEVIVNGTRR